MRREPLDPRGPTTYVSLVTLYLLLALLLRPCRLGASVTKKKKLLCLRRNPVQDTILNVLFEQSKYTTPSMGGFRATYCNDYACA